MYDSIYTDTDREIITEIVYKEVEINVVQGMQKQNGSTDCGVFSIAIATSLLHINIHPYLPRKVPNGL